ncbi:MAG: YlmC/YmxH family sporulation protein [Bacilli bacterium]|nr:YlmC/YmxH family sporulation protein [Bacilli bacterium]
MYLGELQTKDVVSTNDGKNLGRIVDVEINSDGVITNILIEKRRFFIKLFGSSSQYNITYKEITKIGDDVILVNM